MVVVWLDIGHSAMSSRWLGRHVFANHSREWNGRRKEGMEERRRGRTHLEICCSSLEPPTPTPVALLSSKPTLSPDPLFIPFIAFHLDTHLPSTDAVWNVGVPDLPTEPITHLLLNQIILENSHAREGGMFPLDSNIVSLNEKHRWAEKVFLSKS